MSRGSKVFWVSSVVLAVLAITGCKGGSPSVMVTTTSLPNGTVGVAYDQTLAATGGVAPYTWTQASGGAMPGGVRFSSAGAFTGIPTTAGSFGPYVFTVTDSSGVTANSVSLSISITSTALNVSTTSLPAGIVGTPYSTLLVASGGNLPYTWAQTSGGALPPGLQSVTSSGVISGTPTTAGTYGPYVFAVTDSSNTTAASASLTITINPVAAGVCNPLGNEAALTSSTPYAFLAKGRDATGNPVDIAGSFTANGKGGISAATVDYNGFSNGPAQYQVDLTNSKYAFGSNGQGCFFLFFSGTAAPAANKTSAAWEPEVTYANSVRTRRSNVSAQQASQVFSVQFSFYLGGSDGTTYHTGRIVESDSANTSGTITSGFMHLQDSGAFALSSLGSNYAFGIDGWTSETTGYLRTAIAGSFTNTGGALSAGFADMNVGGTPSGELTGGSGTLGSIDSTTGRGTGSYTIPTGNGPLTFDFAFYVINASDIILLSSNSPVSVGVPLLCGRALASNASYPAGALNGYYLLEDAGFVSNGNVIGNRVDLGTMNATSNGTIPTANTYTNSVGAFSVNNATNESFTIEAASGRVSFSGLSAIAPVAYLTATGTSDDAIAGFLVGTDAASSDGTLVNQSTSAPSFSVSSVSGNFAASTDDDVDGQNGAYLGLVDFSGSGTYTVTSQVVGSVPVVPGAIEISVNSDGSGNLDSSAFALVTNGTQIFAIPEGSDPQVFVFTSDTLPK